MNQPLLSLEDVDVALDGHLVLRAIRWVLRPGENWAVLGRNGSGKSTLLKLIRGELWPVPGRGGRRVYAFDGEPQTTAVGTREQIALVSPELQARYLHQDWTLTATQVVHSGFLGGDYVYQPLTSAQRDRALRIIRQLGLETLMPRQVQSLSTGELRKILIARALAGSPRLLVCDEICDGLDIAARQSLLQTLERLARNGTQLLYTTHREDELFPALSHCLRLEGGRIVHAGPIVARREPPAETSSAARRAASWNTARRARRARRARTLVRIRGADVFLARAPALSQIDFEIRAGEHWAILGPNGSGKSTLLKLILGELHPAWGGSIERFELTPRNTYWEIQRRIGYVSPDLQAHYRAAATGHDTVASGFFASVGLHRRLTAAQRRMVGRILSVLDLEPLASKNILRMSYGEVRKLLIARALVHQPDLLLCDEPFDGLDANGRAEIARTLEAAARNGTNLVVVTHHLGDLPLCTTHLAEMGEGRIVSQGPITSAFSPQFP